MIKILLEYWGSLTANGALKALAVGVKRISTVTHYICQQRVGGVEKVTIMILTVGVEKMNGLDSGAVEDGAAGDDVVTRDGVVAVLEGLVEAV